jgi:hypothetical protein
MPAGCVVTELELGHDYGVILVDDGVTFQSNRVFMVLRAFR